MTNLTSKQSYVRLIELAELARERYVARLEVPTVLPVMTGL